MKKSYFVIYLLFTSIGAAQFAEGAFLRSARSVTVSPNTITPIQTALGYSTLIEFQLKPNQAVLGDQDAFRLEYIGNSVAIKPLLPNGKSNLFIYTDYGRFTFSIFTGPAARADYVVRVKSESNPEPTSVKQPPKSLTKKVILNRSRTIHGGFKLFLSEFKLSTDRKDPRAASVLKFQISSQKEHTVFQPSSFGIKQGSHFISIQSIYLDSLELHPMHPPVNGSIAVLNSEWKRSLPLTIVFAVGVEKSHAFRIEMNLFQDSVTKKKGQSIVESETPLFIPVKSHQ